MRDAAAAEAEGDGDGNETHGHGHHHPHRSPGDIERNVRSMRDDDAGSDDDERR